MISKMINQGALSVSYLVVMRGTTFACVKLSLLQERPMNMPSSSVLNRTKCCQVDFVVPA